MKNLTDNFGERFKYYGADFFYEPKNTDSITFYKIDLNNDFADSLDLRFDVVISTEVIEHIIDTDRFIEQLKKLLRDNGVLIITTPNLAAFFNRIMLLFGYQPIYTEVSWRKSFLGSEIIPGLLEIIGKREKLNDSIFGHLRVFTFRHLRIS